MCSTQHDAAAFVPAVQAQASCKEQLYVNVHGMNSDIPRWHLGACWTSCLCCHCCHTGMPRARRNCDGHRPCAKLVCNQVCRHVLGCLLTCNSQAAAALRRPNSGAPGTTSMGLGAMAGSVRSTVPASSMPLSFICHLPACVRPWLHSLRAWLYMALCLCHCLLCAGCLCPPAPTLLHCHQIQ